MTFFLAFVWWYREYVGIKGISLYTQVCTYKGRFPETMSVRLNQYKILIRRTWEIWKFYYFIMMDIPCNFFKDKLHFLVCTKLIVSFQYADSNLIAFLFKWKLTNCFNKSYIKLCANVKKFYFTIRKKLMSNF